MYTNERLRKINTVCLTSSYSYGNIGGLRCGVEQWQLVGLITRRSQVQVLPPLYVTNHSSQSYGFRLTRRSVVDKNPKFGGFCMNRRPLNSLPLQKAITGFVNYKTAEGLSDRSVDSYRRILEHWAEVLHASQPSEVDDWKINDLFCRDCLASLVSFE